MSEAKEEIYPQPSREEFASLLDESLAKNELQEGRVVKGRVIQIENDLVIIDVGLKTEGRVPLHEFGKMGEKNAVNIGDEVDVYIERIENVLGEAVLSCDKARHEGTWQDLEKAASEGRHITGAISARVKGGFTVELGGVQAFLPGSQIDARPIRDMNLLIDQRQEFQILKIDRRRNNIVVSRRAVLEEGRAEERDKMLDQLEEGAVVEGIVKNITNYGAFIDLGGVDGLLHVTEISWKRIQSPAEILNTDDKVKVKIIRINHKTQRINLSMKQLEDDPWQKISEKYKIGAQIKGRVTNITEYGAFIELEPGIEGLVHVSEMSWKKKNIAPNQILSLSEEVEAEILEVDFEKKRVSLGMKQCQDNPWKEFMTTYPNGAKISGEVKNITDFGLFIGLPDDFEGMVHISDLSWNKSGDEEIKSYKVGDKVDMAILNIDPEKERISLGIKQISSTDLSALGDAHKGDIITCKVLATKDGGIDVELGDKNVRGFIRRADLAKERGEQKPERFAIDQKVDAKITQLDLKNNKITLSIKALEIEEEKEAVKQYGSTDSGASLGDVLGDALKIGFGKKDAEDKKEDKSQAKQAKEAKEAKKKDKKEDS